MEAFVVHIIETATTQGLIAQRNTIFDHKRLGHSKKEVKSDFH